MNQEMLNHIGEITMRVNALETNLHREVGPRLKRGVRLPMISPLCLFEEIRIHLGELLEIAADAGPKE